MNPAGHVARKRFGQNFLHDTRLIERIVLAIAPRRDDAMVEIGPGQAALTRPLLDRLDTLHAIELDRDLAAWLTSEFPPEKLHLQQADALTVDFSGITPGKPLRVVGNLPYNISTPLLLHLFRYLPAIRDMHFMLQEEVVDRLAASPGNKDYGRLSILAQYHCQVDKLFTVPPSAFRPAPKVMSAIVRLTPRTPTVPVQDLAAFSALVKNAFSQRRKTLRNNLKPHYPEEQLRLLPVDLGLRPEQISLDLYITLANCLVESAP